MRIENLELRIGKRFFLLAVILISQFSILNSIQAQTKSQLEKDKARVEQEIKNLNSELAKTKRGSKKSANQVQLIDRKIKERTKLINNLNGQVNLLNIQIGLTQDSIRVMQTRIDSLKNEYAAVTRRLYAERGNLDKLVLVLDTKSYNTAYLRTKYFRDYSRYRRRQAGFICQREDELMSVTLDLNRQQREKSTLIVQEKKQKDELAKEQREHQKILTTSKQREKTLQQQIKDKEKQKNQLQQQIQRIINEEIAKSSKKGKATPTSTGKGGSTVKSTPTDPAYEALSDDFVSNKGRFSWPVYYKSVSREYGRYTHSSGGQNMNYGIDLVCASGTSVTAVFNGTVTRVFTCPNGTKGIIIRHGEYMTVYANMGSVTVSEGSKVTTKQNLGTVYTNSDGVAEFSFQLWQGTNSQNPRNWLRKT
ncbi:MAG: peptidoglycan DD-metalloendopeptidase family protein [Bacteroidales bacterium]|nr:peptidoglycan DD-metalloendopeptidase family protein [Bacteroidales bacterium]